MKKRYFILALILPLMFCGCDPNFGVQEIFGTMLVIDGTENSELRLHIKSPKLLGTDSVYECKLITDEKDLKFIKEMNIAKDNDNFMAFEIPNGRTIKDRTYVNIKFYAVTPNGELYEGVLDIPLLQQTYAAMAKDRVVLKSKDNEMTAVFTYDFHRSI